MGSSTRVRSRVGSATVTFRRSEAHASGTRSTPPGCHGWQRSRRAARAAMPRRSPRVSGSPRPHTASSSDRTGNAGLTAAKSSPGRDGSAEGGESAWAPIPAPVRVRFAAARTARLRQRAAPPRAVRSRRPARACCKIAATRRRILFRTTALPTGLATVMPTTARPVRLERLGPVDGERAGCIAPATLAQTGKLRSAPQAGIAAHQALRR